MKKWRQVYWNDLKSIFREHIILVVLLVAAVIIGTLGGTLAGYHKEQLQTLKQKNKVLEDEQLELLETNILMGEEIDRLMEENQILGSYLAEKEIQYEQ